MIELDRKNLTMLLRGEYLKRLNSSMEIFHLKNFVSSFKGRMLVTYLGIDSNFIGSKIKREDKYFSLITTDHSYSFSLASDEKINLGDKILLNFSDNMQGNEIILRTLDLATNQEFNNSKIIIASKNDRGLAIFMEFDRDEQTLVFDYANNLVMKKSDYYQLFNVEVTNEILNEDLYMIWKLWKEHNMPLFYLLFFTQEILSDLEKNAPWLLDECRSENLSSDDNNLDIIFKNNNKFLETINKIKKQSL